MKKIKVKYPTFKGNFTESVLKNRNMTKEELWRNMSSIEPPQNIHGAMEAATRIADAVRSGEKIALYTDYDADGFGCGVVFTELMRQIPYNDFIVFYNKRNMGFGMNTKGIDIIMARQPDTKLIVTSDNGIVAFEAVEYAKSLGVDVVITDHHIPDESGKLPDAIAVVDPHKDGETCKFQELCGTGVIFKVMALVFYLLGISSKNLNDVIDIVAVATIADVVPLRGDNRILAKEGLKRMSQECRPQWKAFKQLGSVYNPLVSFKSKDVGFFVGPCINACSRMSGDISEPMKAFLDTPEPDVHEAITKLTKVNEVRKTIQRTRTAEAMAYVATCSDRFVLVDMAVCEEGVVGLVAGNICNTTYKPTIVLSKDENGNWKGSGRSIPGVHIKELLDIVNKSHPGVLVGYGGHSQACGLTVYDGKVDELRQALNEYCDKNFDEDLFNETIVVDYILDNPAELPRLFSEKCAMEPFGCEFTEPIVMVKFKPENTRIVKEGKHLIFEYKGIEIISWNSGYHIEGHNVANIEEVVAIGTIESGQSLNCQPELLSIKFANN